MGRLEFPPFGGISFSKLWNLMRQLRKLFLPLNTASTCSRWLNQVEDCKVGCTFVSALYCNGSQSVVPRSTSTPLVRNATSWASSQTYWSLSFGGGPQQCVFTSHPGDSDALSNWPLLLYFDHTNSSSTHQPSFAFDSSSFRDFTPFLSLTNPAQLVNLKSRF